MRKALPIAGVALLAAALWLALRPGAPAEPSPAEDRVDHPRLAPRTQALREALQAARSRAVEVRGGGLFGEVLGEGRGGAHVALSGGGLQRDAVADGDGRFSFEQLPPGAYRLDATAGERAAETLGPIPLGEGEQVRGLTLQLAEAGGLSGLVLDANLREPVDGAELTAGGASAQTDARGAFVLRGLPPGEVTLRVSHPGFVESATQVLAPRGGLQAGVVLLLTRAAHLQGKVMLADHTPVAGAQVIARRYNFGAVADARVVAQSDAAGAFSADVAPGRQTILATLGSGEGRAPELELAAGESRTVELVLDAAGEVSGQVLASDGQPVSGAAVVAVEIQTQRASTPSATGVDGRFRIPGLPEGVYTLVARSGARSAQLAGIRLEPGDAREATLRFGEGVIAGVVVDAQGTPLPGAEVRVAPEGAAPLAESGVQSGAGGRFRIEGLAGERFSVKATHPSGSAEQRGVAPGEAELVLRLVRPSALQGLVTDEGGHAVTDFEIVADPDGPLGAGGAARAMGHFASVAGDFRLQVAPGRYRVRAAAPGFRTSEPVAAEAPVRGESSALRFTLRHGKRVGGVVVDAVTRRPIGGAHVADEPGRVYAYGRSSAVATGASTTTDTAGQFSLEIDPLRPGSGLFATAEGYGFGYAAAPTVDGAQVTVELRPDAAPRPPDFAGVGMQLGPNFAIVNVFDSGPAYLAGLRSGDVLVSVDGRPVAGHPMDEVIGWIRGEVGTPVALGVQRGAEAAVLVPTRAEIKF